MPPCRVVAPGLFHGRWTYVEQASLSRNVVHFLFNPDAQNPVVFHARSTWADSVSGASLQTNERLRALGNVDVPVPGEFRDRPLRLTVRLDDALAFAGVLEPLPATMMISSR